MRRRLPLPQRRPPLFLPFAVALLVAGCDRPGEARLEEDVMESAARGAADDGDPATAAARYDGALDTFWAEDSLTSAYSDPPAPARVAGGVTAEAADTVPAAGSVEAEARSLTRGVTPLRVGRSGRFELEIRIDLTDVEVSNGGQAGAAVRAVITDSTGTPLTGGAVSPLVLELRPGGTVVVDGVEGEPEFLNPNLTYSNTVRGPRGGIRLQPGLYRLELELALIATAPVAAGPHQLGRIGHARAEARIR